MGRPQKYTDATRVRVAPDGSSKLHAGGDRRAVINWLIDQGGAATLGEIDEAFGVSMRDLAGALIRVGWLRVTNGDACGVEP